jgi:hypothetical protein
VGDDEAGAALHEPLEGRLHEGLALGVEGAGGLVEDEDAGVLEDRAGDREALPLPAGEVDAALAEVGVVAGGQDADELVGVGGLGGLDDLVVGGAGAGRT